MSERVLLAGASGELGSRIAACFINRAIPMRGMTRYYHEQFFSDIRLQVLVTVALFVVGFWEVEGAFLLIPVVALYGAVQTAFDASYLIFARQYAARLEIIRRPVDNYFERLESACSGA